MIRSMTLGVVFVMAVTPAWAVQKSKKIAQGVSKRSPAEIESAIRKLEGYVTRDEERPGGPVISISLCSSSGITANEQVELVSNLPELMENLRSLNLEDTQISDAAVPVLATLKRLWHLNVGHTDVTPAGAKTLREALLNCYINADDE